MKQKKIPPSDKWEWFEFNAVDTRKYIDYLFQRMFSSQGLKILNLEVKISDKAVMRSVKLLPYRLVYINHLHIGKQIAFKCVRGSWTPFKLDSKSKKEFCNVFNRSLQRSQSLGKKLFRSKGLIHMAKDIAKALQEKS